MLYSKETVVTQKNPRFKQQKHTTKTVIFKALKYKQRDVKHVYNKYNVAEKLPQAGQQALPMKPCGAGA